MDTFCRELLLPMAGDVVIDVVAHHGVEALVREVEMHGVAH